MRFGIIRSASAALFFAACCAAQSAYIISTIAGGGVPDVVPSLLNASLNMAASGGTQAQSITADPAGNIYFGANNCIFRRNAASGVTIRIAGSTSSQGFAGDGGPALKARFSNPTGLAVDASGNVYVSDYGNNRVRKIGLDGTITTIAGNGFSGFSGDGGQATSAALQGPQGLAFDQTGNLYIADAVNSRIRKVSTTGIINTAAGNGFDGYSGDAGPATSAAIGWPYGLAFDGVGNLFFADILNHRIRRISTTSGLITTAVGTGTFGESGEGGPAINAQIEAPSSVAISPAGDLYFTDLKSVIHQVDASGILHTVAGNGIVGFSGDGGPALSAELSIPTGVTFDPGGVLYFDDGTVRIRAISPDGIISTFAGSGISGYSGDGSSALAADIGRPSGVAVGPDGSVYVSNYFSPVVRKISPNGIISTVAGNGLTGFSGDGGPATAAKLNQPSGLAVDTAGNLYIADTSNYRIRKVSASTGIITTITGGSSFVDSGDGLPATSASISPPNDVAVDSAGNIYIACGFGYVRKIGANGIISTVAGNGTSGFSGDGGPAINAQLGGIFTVQPDRANGFFIFDPLNNRIRHVNAAGTISTIAGNGFYGYSGDGGPATSAMFKNPWGGLLDAAGNLLVIDKFNFRIRRIDINGNVTTVAGNGSETFAGDGVASLSTGLGIAEHLAMDPVSGALYLPDEDANVMRALTRISGPAVLGVSKTHALDFSSGQIGETYTVTVGDAAFGGPTSGAVTVTELTPTGLNLSSMSGNGWNCTGNGCSRSDVLTPGNQYPPITVTVDVPVSAPKQLINVINVSGGGSLATGSADTTNILIPPSAPTLITPANFSNNVASGLLSWSAADGATAYDVYFGTSPTPSFAGTTSSITFGPQSLAIGTTYYWRVVAKNSVGSTTSATFFFTTINVCSFSLGSNQAQIGPGSAIYSVSITTFTGCSWTAAGNAGWLAISSGSAGSGDGTVSFLAGANPLSQRTGTLTIAGKTFTVTQTGLGLNPQALRFRPVPPCRVVDTRNSSGPLGGPAIAANSSRDFVISGPCNVPRNADAYSLNVTVVPLQPLGFLQVYPTGRGQPAVSTLNSPDGRIKANAAIVPAGDFGAITVYASHATQVIIDINGYFELDPFFGDYSFYPLTPCRVSDTRNPAGPLGGPMLAPNSPRDFSPYDSPCRMSGNPLAYSLNMTVVPPAPVGFLSAWPTGVQQPGVSVLNDPTGTVVANAAIVPVGFDLNLNGPIRVVATNATDLVIDINGYFAVSGAPGGLSFYPLTPCRLIDTRSATGVFGGPILAANTSRDIPVMASACGIPETAKAYSLNATVVPPAGLGFLQLWNTGGAQPGVSTLNASDGFITSNAAIVPAGVNGSVTAFASHATHLILDINGYFAP